MRHPIIRLLAVLACVPGAGLAPRTIAVSADEHPCAAATALAPGAVAYGHGLDAGDTVFYSVEVPKPGRLAVGLTVPGREDNLPWIEVLSRSEITGEAQGRHQPRTGLARHDLEVTTPGTVCVRVGAVDPRSGLEAYAVSVGFSPTRRSPGSSPSYKSGDSGNDDDTEDWNNEIVPLVFEAPVDPTDACGNDGASNSILCAQEIGLNNTADGDLEQGWAGSFFSFTVDRTQNVLIRSAGPTDTQGVLYDASGHRLLVADDGGEAENFAFTAQLPPGRYFIRVEGAVSPAGSYQLIVTGS